MFSIASWNDESRVCSFAKYMEIYRKYTEYDVIFSYYLLIHNLTLYYPGLNRADSHFSDPT